MIQVYSFLYFFEKVLPNIEKLFLDKDEIFNAVAWSYGPSGPLLGTGGVKGVVRVISCNKPANCYKNLVGHSKV